MTTLDSELKLEVDGNEIHFIAARHEVKVLEGMLFRETLNIKVKLDRTSAHKLMKHLQRFVDIGEV
jgi:hypothetical protein